MNPAATKQSGTALQALTAAALLLPGLVGSAHAAEADTLNLQVSRYEEGSRNLVDVDSRAPALRADSLHLSGSLLLRDSIRATFALAQDTWSGATPVAVAPLAAHANRPVLRNTTQGVAYAGASPIVNNNVPLDGRLAPVGDPRAVLVMSSASPEVRQQVDVGVEIPLQTLAPITALTIAGGLSDEPDYRSRYARVGTRLAFNDNLTTLSLAAAHTRSDTHAVLDPDLLPYLTRHAYASQLVRADGAERLYGERRDRSVELGLTQVLDAASVFDLGFTLNRARGFMENPYKTVSIIFAGTGVTPTLGDMRAFVEQRPDARRQMSLRAHYARHIAATDATLQLDYSHSRDDWGIDTHSIELGWAQSLGAWTLTPRLRYYTQSAADFHTDWLVSRQNYRSVRFDALGEPQITLYSPALLPAHFSSDHRLAAFASGSAGLTLQRRLARGLIFEAGFEYYTRADGLYSGSDPGSAYADFDFAMANLALTVDLQSAARRARREAADHATHDSTSAHAAYKLPAGLMFAHGGHTRGTLMTGYRASHRRHYGALITGTDAVPDAVIAAQACRPAARCSFVPSKMTMTMHMVDLMYTVTDTTTLMLMPQYMTMDMQQRSLPGPPVPGVHNHGNARHSSGALGDTVLAAIFSLRSDTLQSLHASLGISAPTGKTHLEHRRAFQTDGGLMHYDMQSGSGTWDFMPSLTWQATRGAWQLGAQLSGNKRLEERNEQGYRLGDEVQFSAWSTRELSANTGISMRALWQHRGAIDGAFNAYNAASSPQDFPGNHGGEFIDVGLGFNVTLAGSELAVEWLAPVHDDVNGVQLERQGALLASWHYNY